MVSSGAIRNKQEKQKKKKKKIKAFELEVTSEWEVRIKKEQTLEE